MKRSPDETVQEFLAKFIKFYNLIPPKVKPSLKLPKSNMLNLLKANSCRDMRKNQDKAQPSISQTSQERFETMMRTMERMMEIMALNNRPNPREQADGPPKNPRGPVIP